MKDQRVLKGIVRGTMAVAALSLAATAGCSAGGESTAGESAGGEEVGTTEQPLDQGYSNLPRWREDMNGDGLWDYCRVVGNPDERFLSCAYQAPGGDFPDETQYAYNSVRGLDLGQPTQPRLFEDVDGDGRSDYCRFVGRIYDGFLSCNLARDYGYDWEQYTYNAPHTSALDGGRFLDINSDGRPDYCSWEPYPDDVWLQCCNYNEGNGFSDEHCINTDPQGNPIGGGGGGGMPDPINQPVRASCACKVNSDKTLDQTRTACFPRGQDYWWMRTATAQQCGDACVRAVNSNWELEEGADFWLSEFTPLDGDCVQSFGNLFEF